jgi:hypothetical protein
MIRWVRLLYLEIGDFTKSLRECCQTKSQYDGSEVCPEVVDSASKYSTVALLLGQHSRSRIEAEQRHCLPR